MTTAPVTLDEFKGFLNIKLTDTTLDAELAIKLARATEQVESACGPMVARAVTERVRGIAWDGSFQLQVWPVISVTKVCPHITGVAMDLTALDFDADTGVVNGMNLSMWSTVVYDVTVSAGRTVVPGPLCEATMIVGEQLWQTQRGPVGASRFAQSGLADVTSVPVYKGFAWPSRAKEIVVPYLQPWVG